jgi:hypothetical protein
MWKFHLLPENALLHLSTNSDFSPERNDFWFSQVPDNRPVEGAAEEAHASAVSHRSWMAGTASGHDKGVGAAWVALTPPRRCADDGEGEEAHASAVWPTLAWVVDGQDTPGL